MPMKIKLVWLFAKWCFMNMFSGMFIKLENFRYELKRGAPDSIFAIAGFVILSLIFVIATVLLSAWLIEDKETVKLIAGSAFWLTVFTLFYNVIKAAFECFIEERDRLFQILKDSK